MRKHRKQSQYVHLAIGSVGAARIQAKSSYNNMLAAGVDDTNSGCPTEP